MISFFFFPPDFIFGVLAHTWQDLKALKKNIEGFQICKSNSGRTARLERHTFMTFQHFLDQLKNKKKNTFQFSLNQTLKKTKKQHVIFAFSFIFAASVYFMSTKKKLVKYKSII